MQVGHANLTSKWSLHMCAQMAAHEVGGLSLHLSTWHLYTLLMPPIASKGVPCGWGWLPPKLGRQMKSESLVPGQPLQLQEQRLQVQVLQTPEGSDGIWWQWENGGIFGWGGVEDMGECDMAPLKSPTDPPPLILSLLTQSSAAPPSPTAVLPPIVSWPISTNLTPEKEKRRSVTKARLSHRTVKEWLERLSHTR